ncbi:ly6/PLAUR domain-containing protein 5 isoform X2 [Halichoerus grypus]
MPLFKGTSGEPWGSFQNWQRTLASPSGNLFPQFGKRQRHTHIRTEVAAKMGAERGEEAKPEPNPLCVWSSTEESSISVCVHVGMPASQARQCYNFQHIYFGPFDLSSMKFHNVSCPHGCSEAVLSLDTGYRASVTMVQKGCWTGPPTGRMLSNDHALPPDYSVVRGCATDLCNADLMTHDSIPNLSPAPNPPTLSGLQCYACLGIHPEDCTPEKSRQVHCHQDQSVCFQGNGQMTVEPAWSYKKVFICIIMRGLRGSIS